MAEDAAGPSSGDQRRRRSSSSSTCSSSSEEQSALAAVSTAVLASSSTCSSSSEEQSALAAISTAELAAALYFTAKRPHLFCDLNFLESVALILRLQIKSDVTTKEMVGLVAEECLSRSPALLERAKGCQRTFQDSRMSLALVPPEKLMFLITKDVIDKTLNNNSSMPYELLASMLSDELEHVVSADACRRLCDRMGLPLLPERGVTMASLDSAGWWESAIVRRARAPEGLSTDEDMRRLLDASVVPDDAQDLERDAPLDTAEVPPAMRNLPLMQRLKRNVIAAVDRMDLSPEGMQRSCIAFENQPERQYISLVCATGEGGTKLIFLVDGECATGTRVSLVSAVRTVGRMRCFCPLLKRQQLTRDIFPRFCSLPEHPSTLRTANAESGSAIGIPVSLIRLRICLCLARLSRSRAARTTSTPPTSCTFSGRDVARGTSFPSRLR